MIVNLKLSYAINLIEIKIIEIILTKVGSRFYSFLLSFHN